MNHTFFLLLPPRRTKGRALGSLLPFWGSTGILLRLTHPWDGKRQSCSRLPCQSVPCLQLSQILMRVVSADVKSLEHFRQFRLPFRDKSRGLVGQWGMVLPLYESKGADPH